ncbi:hypothetical protein WKI27_11930 [Brevundimonas vesicularis]|uniref:hypothetical protein n=1 Tax=Brevundimonas vesicularis TaxID=41276 RepID=UPI0030C1F056
MARAPTAAQPIKVMLSSQCKRAFPIGGRTLTEIRQDIRDRLEAARLLDQPVFEVWINEDAPPAHLAVNSWDTCLDSIAKADIVIAVSTGHAGWTRTPGDVGICHAELMKARDTAPSKVRLIPIEGTAPLSDEDAASNQRFKDYLDTVNAFSSPVRDEASLMAMVDRAVMDAVTTLVENGAREGRKGRFDSGDALVWSKMGYDRRARAMVDTLVASLKEDGGVVLSDDRIYSQLGAAQVLFKISACPDALSVAASRERIGRPFLADHHHIEGVDPAVVGPIHLIACGGGATETQARALLGFPDATILRTRFGVFVADAVQKIQFALLRDCRDATSTRHALHRLLDWLRENQEAEPAAERAASRRRIVEAIGKEV